MIGITVTVDDRDVQAHLDRLPMEIRAKLLPTIESLTQRLLTGVRAAEPMKTGALRAATRSKVSSGETYIQGSVTIGPRITGKGFSGTFGHNVAAAALEYGVHSTFSVASHRMRLTHIYGRAADEFVMVNEYTRRVSITARRFLRDPFERMKPLALAEIKAALAEQKL